MTAALDDLTDEDDDEDDDSQDQASNGIANLTGLSGPSAQGPVNHPVK